MLLHQRFDDIAKSIPAATAVVAGDISMTYREVDEAARWVCAELQNVRAAGGLAGVMLTRGHPLLASAIIGVLRAGLAYVPIDPAYPSERIDYLVSDAGVSVIVTSDGLAGRLKISNRNSLRGHSVVSGAEEPVAYVIYTSGSTGQPKGVVVTHRNLLSLIDACDSLFSFSDADVWSWFHSPSFDFSVWEMWGALLHGSSIVMVPGSATQDPTQLYDLVKLRNVTVLNLVPTALSALLLAHDHKRQGRPLTSLRYLILGGEPYRRDTIEDWARSSVAPNCKVVNMYGITETTVHATYCELTPTLLAARGKGSCIGTPLPHLSVRLVTDAGDPARPDQEGEIWLAGSGVAAGYLGKDDATAARFICQDGRRWYKSGDYATETPEGLRYLGRRDDQVKLRGFRIELGEVEQVVAGHYSVAACACGVEATAAGDPQLVAYVVLRSQCTADASLRRDLRDHCNRRLPRHMVPNRFKRLAELPLTPSGKIDRSSLPDLARDFKR